MPGPNNAVVTSAIMSLQATPEYEAGDDFRQKNGCGEVCVALKDCDHLVRMNLNMSLCLRDPAFIELVTGATVYTDANGLDIIGLSRRGVGAACPGFFSLEIWTKAVGNTGSCQVPAAGSTVDAQWWRHVYPRVTMTLGESTFGNEVATVNFTGFSEPNPRLLNGCFNDVPTYITLDPTSPEHSFLDEIGPPSASDNYVSVPVQ